MTGLRSTIIFLLACSSLLFLPASTWGDRSEDHSACQKDEDCVPMTSLKQACRHIDENAAELCPVINRKFASEIENISCYRNVPCREVKSVTCEQGHCKGEQ